MRRSASIALCLGWLFVAVSTSSAGVELVDEQNGRLTFAVRFDEPGSAAGSLSRLSDPGLPPLSYERIFVAIPPGSSVRLDVTDGRFTEKQGNLPEPVELEPGTPGVPVASTPQGYFPASPCTSANTFTFRKTRVAAIDCFRSQVDYTSGRRRVWSEYRVIVTYPPAPSYARSVQADPLLASLVENRAYLPVASHRKSPAAVPVPDPQFSRSSNWLRIRVSRPGVYLIRGSDLAQAGVTLSSIIDPGSFRLFTGGGVQHDRDLTRPDGTWIPGNWMNECDVIVEYGGDGTFDPVDRIIFYGLGVADYEDLYRSGAPRESRLDHLYVRDNLYFLTWDANPGFDGTPARMALQTAVPTAGTDVTTFEDRLYFEEDRVREISLGGDGWVWQNIARRQGEETRPFPRFTVTDLDPSQPQTFRTVALAPFSATERNTGHHAVYWMNDVDIGDIVWNTLGGDRFEDAKPVLISRTGLVTEGSNEFKLHLPRRDVTSPFAPNEDFMLFAWYEVRYHRFLKAGSALPFSSPDTSGTVNYGVTDLNLSGQLYLFDVTDHFHPKVLGGFTESVAGTSRTIRFASDNSGVRQYFWAGTAAGFSAPAGLQRYFPRDLRNVGTSPHMLIVTHPLFRSAAANLHQHRLGNLPFFANPSVEVVTAIEIFDNFSGGLADPVAIRNYCKFLYDNFTDGAGNPLLTFLLLLGDANVDAKNFTSSVPNFVTTNVNMNQFTLDAYVTDDWFALMDSSDVGGRKFIDFPVGRLPAASAQEANQLVNRVIEYETQAAFGNWRDIVILVADDENSFRDTRQAQFVLQSEAIANAKLARYFDPLKVYLTEFPAISGIKPASRLFFLNAWNEGALVINYVGHGSSKQMADEQVFLDTDIPLLDNGLRLPLLIAVSCTMGKFAEAGKSLSEKLLLKQDGGAIATITASELSFIGPNETFDFNVFELMFPTTPGLAEPLGVGLMKAKFKSLSASPSRLVLENNEKYNLLGDPAMRLLSPHRRIVFDPLDIDTLVTGKRHIVRGSVRNNGGQVDTGFSGTVRLVVREPDDQSGYQREDGFGIAYNYPGGTVYQGTADVNAGQFEFSFKVPRSAQTGDLGFILGYADNSSIDAVARFDSI
ncbi:MAG: C25 family cysteine peptidase, partial [Candidatus Krumholzibacteria bacterium]